MREFDGTLIDDPRVRNCYIRLGYSYEYYEDASLVAKRKKLQTYYDGCWF